MKSKAAVRRIVEALKTLYPTPCARCNTKKIMNCFSPCGSPPSAPMRA